MRVPPGGWGRHPIRLREPQGAWSVFWGFFVLRPGGWLRPFCSPGALRRRTSFSPPLPTLHKPRTEDPEFCVFGQFCRYAKIRIFSGRNIFARGAAARLSGVN
jgi:hypothetical protein